MENIAQHYLSQQDALLIAERLLSWTDESVRDDLSAYPDVHPEHAVSTRDMLLRWLKDLNTGRYRI